MPRRRLITLSITLAGALLALLFFSGGYRFPFARFLYDLAIFGAALAAVSRIHPARTVRGEIYRLALGVLAHTILAVLLGDIAPDYLATISNPSETGWLLLNRIPISLSLAWSGWALLRLDGSVHWRRRRRSIIAFVVLALFLLAMNAPAPILTIIAAAFVLFVQPWNWIEGLGRRSGWLILLFFALAPLGFLLFIGSIGSTGAEDGVSVSLSSSVTNTLMRSSTLELIGHWIGFTWFAIPLKLTVGLFQGLFGMRIPIWFKFGTTYVFSTIIPGILLILLVLVGVYVGIGSLRAQLVRDLIHDDLRDLESALVEGRLNGYALGDSVASATYRRIFPTADRRGNLPLPPNPLVTKAPEAEYVPGTSAVESLPRSWSMYTYMDSLLGTIGPLEVWVKDSQSLGNWLLPDTLTPFPGWTYTAANRYGILPVSEQRVAYAAAAVSTNNPGQVLVAMRPLNKRALQPYKQTVRSDITLYPIKVIQMGSERGLQYNFSGDQNFLTNIKISTTPDSGGTFWNRYVVHGVSELENWPGANQYSSTLIGQVVVHTSLESLVSTLYAWEGINRLTVIGLLVLTALFGLAVLFSTLLAAGITRTIMRSVRELRHGTDQLRQGDLEVQIKPRSNDELGDLALSFNQMTADLRRMISEVTVKERLEREIQIARRIQIHLLPTELPQRPTLKVGAHSDPAFEVGGDYYDCIDLGPRGLLVVLGDVSGKGVGAAVLMSNLQASLSLLATQDIPLEELVRQLNLQVCKNSTPEMFITFFAGLFDPDRMILSYVNAGHDMPVIIRFGKPMDLATGGMLLGIVPDTEYEAATISLEPGDLFAAYSDGLTEAMNAADQEFGRDRLIQTLDRYKHLEAHRLVGKVLETIRDYAGNERAGQDDLTLITVHVVEL